MSGCAINRVLGSLSLAIFLTSTTRAVVIQTVPVGSPGNAPDPATGSRYGAVPYDYNIGTYDVTNAQYAEFLNAKASVSDPYGLWSMPNPSGDEGISRTGVGPYVYSVNPGYANKPVVYVSWFDAIRFVNWLQNGQGNGDTESGTYSITGAGPNQGPPYATVVVPSAAQRAAWAAAGQFHWLLASENEWYKAAYYNPSNGTYYSYPFQSNALPTAASPPGGPNTGNFSRSAFNSDGFGSDLTDVGSYTSSTSPFGSYDMGGDVWQWNDTTIDGVVSKGIRGSGWLFGGPEFSNAGVRPDDWFPNEAASYIGFRMASVPEPSALVLLGIGVLGLLGIGRMKRRGGEFVACQ
jgi:formylglycine-generating enzyme